MLCPDELETSKRAYYFLKSLETRFLFYPQYFDKQIIPLKIKDRREGVLEK